MGFNKMFYALGYVLVAAVTGCLVVPVQEVGIAAGVIFGVLMSGLVFLSARMDTAAHQRFNHGSKRSFAVQLLAVMLLYVVVPAAVVGVLHLIVPSLVFFTTGWQMLLGLLWMPLLLASVLQFIAKLP
jgi:hypothetical protein